MYNICEHRQSPLVSLIKCSYGMVTAVRKDRFGRSEMHSVADSNASTNNASSPIKILRYGTRTSHRNSFVDRTGDFGLMRSMTAEEKRKTVIPTAQPYLRANLIPPELRVLRPTMEPKIVKHKRMRKNIDDVLAMP